MASNDFDGETARRQALHGRAFGGDDDDDDDDDDADDDDDVGVSVSPLRCAALRRDAGTEKGNPSRD